MKKNKFILLFTLLFSTTLFANVNFSGFAGGSIGFAGKTNSDEPFGLPFNSFAALQLNMDSWGIFRANFELSSKDITEGNIFVGQDAILKMNELSLVLTKNSDKVSNYFGFYFGTYEVVGQDEFLQRQFGIDPFTSLITKNRTTLATGIPLFENQGIGFAYTANFNSTPGTFGINAYFNMAEDDTSQLNIDLRTAWALQYVTFDLALGVGAPLQNKYGAEDVILLIDTLYLHGGITLLLGNVHTHSLFLQAGVQNIKISKGDFEKEFDSVKDFSLIVEPRIYAKNFRTSLSFYSLPTTTINQMMYLKDSLGVAFSFSTDAFNTKKSNINLGVHLIGSATDKSFIDIFTDDFNSTVSDNINLYVTPFITFPLANGDFEVHGQIGLSNIKNDVSVNYEIIAGYKKTF